MHIRVSLLVLMVFSFVAAAKADHLVADTEPLTPAEQQKKFHLPPGFEIQLVGCEPDVHKPMNLKFDVHGRLWVTHSLEYPFPAKEEANARDAITIFSSLGEDGLAKKVERFAEKLNIPIGVLPLSDKEALAWSIPHIYRLIDTDGDGVADERKPAFGPFAFTDTHGNQNAFTRWIDGWVYANHGFNNDSRVKLGAQGEEVLRMQSGNTYRFRPDGSAIEQYSWGQVNPFGLSFDPLGNLYSADCHSRPVTMLLREGYYQSFGKPHDGLGYAPETTTIDHGGTGIAGVVYSTFPTWPKDYRDVLFVGNVITNRVHCDRLKWAGSSPTVEKVEDFLKCDDPWFRPVDLQQGPDGALYIADFYNCIIGHYEVPLTHPKRDRERGRIWRVVYKGDGKAVAPAIDLASLSADELVNQLGNDNLTLRMQATNQLLDRFGEAAGARARKVLEEGQSPVSAAPSLDRAAQTAHAVWIAQRTGQLDEPLAHKLAEDHRPMVRVHLTRALGEMTEREPWQLEIVRGRLADADPFVRRAAAESLAKTPAIENLQPLLQQLAAASGDDACLVHAIRIALRDQMRSPDVDRQLANLKLSPAESKQFLEFAASAPTGPAAVLIFDEALRGNVADELLIKALPSAARYVDPARIDPMIEHVVARFAQTPDLQLSVLRGMSDGLVSRGVALSEPMRRTLAGLLKPALASDATNVWANLPLLEGPPTASPWTPQAREYSDGQKGPLLISSLKDSSPAAEKLGGVLRSPVFTLPPKLSFFLCGHNGPPDTKDKQISYIRLVLEDGAEVARSYPPRSDVAQPFSWDLSSQAGKRGYVEVVDGNTQDTGYAWIAVGRFDPAAIIVPATTVGDSNAALAEALRAVGSLRLAELSDDAARLANDTSRDSTVRVTACETLAALKPESAVTPLTALMADSSLPILAREQSAQQLGRINCDESRAALLAQLKAAPQTVAVQIAAALAGHPKAAESLLKEIGEGRASPELLREAAVADRLKSSGLADVEKQIADLTANLSPADNRVVRLIESRRNGFLAVKTDVQAGRELFAKSVCANCHRIGEVGKQIGPALDGIGNRGLDRLLEDTLDPNRNVDQAFRTIVLATDEGQVLSGFGVREEGATTVLNDSKGELVRVPTDQITERKTSMLSPMPANVIEQIPPQDFYNLIAFLLSQRSK